MPAAGEVALDAFYPIVIAALPVGLAGALALEGRPRAASLLMLLALLVEEEAALVLLGFGMYLILQRSNRSLGLSMMTLAVAWLVLVQTSVMPTYQQSEISGEASRAESHFGELRAAPAAWLGQVALNRLDPDLIRLSGLGRLVGQPIVCADAGHCSALRWWLYPTAGLALLSPPTLLMTVPTEAALLLADKPGRFRRHWVAPILPIIWMAVAIGLVRIRERGRQAAQIAGLALMAATSVYFYFDGSLPGAVQFEPEDLMRTAVGTDLEMLRTMIPVGASASSSRRALAHLTNRPQVYVFPPKDYGAGLWPPDRLPDFVLVDLTNGDSARELAQPSTSTNWRSGYRELARLTNAVLLIQR
jgi:hypothetical protein